MAYRMCVLLFEVIFLHGGNTNQPVAVILEPSSLAVYTILFVPLRRIRLMVSTGHCIQSRSGGSNGIFLVAPLPCSHAWVWAHGNLLWTPEFGLLNQVFPGNAENTSSIMGAAADAGPTGLPSPSALLTQITANKIGRESNSPSIAMAEACLRFHAMGFVLLKFRQPIFTGSVQFLFSAPWLTKATSCNTEVSS